MNPKTIFLVFLIIGFLVFPVFTSTQSFGGPGPLDEIGLEHKWITFGSYMLLPTHRFAELHFFNYFFLPFIPFFFAKLITFLFILVHPQNNVSLFWSKLYLKTLLKNTTISAMIGLIGAPFFILFSMSLSFPDNSHLLLIPLLPVITLLILTIKNQVTSTREQKFFLFVESAAYILSFYSLLFLLLILS